ncbi:Cell division cycle protein 27, partial [Nowakowskiella sp. JEL0078]
MSVEFVPSDDELLLAFLVGYFKRNSCLKSALFFSERLTALSKNNLFSIYILADIYYDLKKFNIVTLLLNNIFSLLTSSSNDWLTLESCHLLANAFLNLGDYKNSSILFAKLKDTTSPTVINVSNNSYLSSSCFSTNPDIATSIFKLGVASLYVYWILDLFVCKVTGRKSNKNLEAISHFKKSLSLNPFLWSAFEQLCILGVELDIDQIFTVESARSFLQRAGFSSILQPEIKLGPIQKAKKSEVAISDIKKNGEPATKIVTRLRSAGLVIEKEPRILKKSSRSAPVNEPINRSVRPSTLAKKSSSLLSEPKLQKKRTRPTSKSELDDDNRMDLDDDLISAKRTTLSKGKSKPALSRKTSIPTRNSQLESQSSSKNFSQIANNHESNEKENNHDEVEFLINLLKKMAEGFYSLSRLECEEAIAIFEEMEVAQNKTGWVYAQAEEVFRKMRDIEPHRLQYLDYFSTALWHLQKEVELSYLAHELIEFDRNAHET